MTTQLDTATAELVRPGGPLDLGPDKTRMLNRLFRLLTQGRPVSPEQVQDAIADLGVDRQAAEDLVDAWAERDDAGNVVGLGVTYNPTPHRMAIDGADMWAWCAIDTLIFAVILGKPIEVESAAPRALGTVRLVASPDGVSHPDPATAVITWPTRRRDQVDISSTQAIWGTFCHHSFLFPSQQAAEEWAAGRDDVQILSLDEGFAVAEALAGAWLRYE